MMPEGMELNVKVEYDVCQGNSLGLGDNIREEDQENVRIDFSRIRRKVTHYYKNNNSLKNKEENKEN